ncbi:hypothetical protein DPMN_122236 [Dreissena polymorpha]|uniref:Uncharacterized protein n=1 Tax=Dreissena polymorpha TaxID=45954 RepID=A0A9D4JQ77_DREPO|nr:hypothetical protein DPMN_122194 [Dreissena polymorpha]KAH3820490.1 hypothetical protein DPMN_122236 [Dreissena polymorpha]
MGSTHRTEDYYQRALGSPWCSGYDVRPAIGRSRADLTQRHQVLVTPRRKTH